MILDDEKLMETAWYALNVARKIYERFGYTLDTALKRERTEDCAVKIQQVSEDREREFDLNYSEALLIRRSLEHCYTEGSLKSLLTAFSAEEREEAYRLQWKIKDAFC